MKLDTRYTTIKHKVERGLVPRDSDLFHIFTILQEVLNEKEPTHHKRVDGGAEESVRPARRGRPKKVRVREGSSVRNNPSTSKDSAMEGGSEWAVKADPADQAHQK